MPFLGQDWRGPGHNWSKVGCSNWEAQEPNIGVMHDPIPRYMLVNFFYVCTMYIWDLKTHASMDV